MGEGEIVHLESRPMALCSKCGKASRLEVHHKIALENGGTNDPVRIFKRCASGIMFFITVTSESEKTVPSGGDSLHKTNQPSPS